MAGEFSSLQDLYKAAPGVAAFMTGQQRAQEMQASQLANQSAELKNQNDAAMNPLNQQFRQGEINQQGETLRGTQITNDTNALTLDSKQQTHDLAVKAEKSKLLGQIGDDQVKELGRYGQIAGNLSAYLEAVPPMFRKQKALEALQQSGIDANSPIVQQLLSTSPDQMPKAFAGISTRMTQLSSQYITEMEKQKLQNQGTAYTADRHLEGVKYAADKGYDRASLSTKTLEMSFNTAKSARDKHAAAVALAQQSLTSGDTPGYQKWTAMAQSLRPQAEAEISAANAKPGAPALDKLGIQTNPNLSIAPPGGAAAPQTPDISEAVRRAGQQYEPDKYEYRIGPNGNVQRKPKG